VFGTVLTPLVHPIFAAKQMVTADHIGRGRFGLNIVCGWNQDEFDMFGQTQLPHDERYAQGQEWWDVIRRIWESDAAFDYSGAYYNLAGVKGSPKPYGGARPVVMSAGSSPAGQRFAAKNCDMMFTSLVDFDHARGKIAQIKEHLAALGRRDQVGVFTSTHVVCRPTKKEAEEFYRHYAIDNADDAAVERLMYLQGMFAQSYPKEIIARNRVRFAAGHGSYPIVGDPDHVAAELARVPQAGFSGTTVAFMNYLDSFPYFAAEVMPRLERMGVRDAKVPACA
jgi:alkanesulfonate monooxygenase SsuD/methylene tetrahydromethanopterin reductase-like flavin-dependent oxidoreductase (luciferase family)